MNLTRTSTRLVAGAAALTLLLGACGDDDETASDTGTDGTAAETADPTTGDTAAGASTAFCDSFFDAQSSITQAMSQGPDVDPATVSAALADEIGDDVETIRAEAPEELAGEVETILTAVDGLLEGGDPSGFENPEFSTANVTVNQHLVDDCGYAGLEAELTEYAFEGLPDDTDAGRTVLTVENTGSELHEAVVMKVNDGVEESAEELLALPEEEAMGKVTPAGMAFAFPGQSASTVLDLEPGRYIVVCFLPVGATPEAMEEMEATGAEPQGLPHAMEGMVHELTVS